MLVPTEIWLSGIALPSFVSHCMDMPLFDHWAKPQSCLHSLSETVKELITRQPGPAEHSIFVVLMLLSSATIFAAARSTANTTKVPVNTSKVREKTPKGEKDPHTLSPGHQYPGRTRSRLLSIWRHQRLAEGHPGRVYFSTNGITPHQFRQGPRIRNDEWRPASPERGTW